MVTMPWLGLVTVGISVDIYAMVGEAVYSQGMCRCLCYGRNNALVRETMVGEKTIGEKTWWPCWNLAAKKQFFTLYFVRTLESKIAVKLVFVV